MKILITSMCISILLGLVIISCKNDKSDIALSDSSRSTKASCEEGNDTYWYNDTCWNNAEEIRGSAIPSEKELLQSLKNFEAAKRDSYIKVGEISHEIEEFFILAQDSMQIVFVIYEGNNQYHTLILALEPGDMESIGNGKTVEMEGGLTHAKNNPFDGSDFVRSEARSTFSVSFFTKEENDEQVMTIEGMQDDQPISASVSGLLEGSGVASLDIQGDKAYLTGTLGASTYNKIKQLESYPEVKTLVLANVPGSLNDSVNVYTGRLIKSLGLNTYIPFNSEVSSGGVDLFAAGKERIVEQGGKVGIHSWCCFADLGADELPKSHPAHRDQIDYYTIMMGEEDGVAFYFRTLAAATADSMHFMSQEEMLESKIVTQIIDAPQK